MLIYSKASYLYRSYLFPQRHPGLCAQEAGRGDAVAVQQRYLPLALLRLGAGRSDHRVGGRRAAGPPERYVKLSLPCNIHDAQSGG